MILKNAPALLIILLLIFQSVTILSLGEAREFLLILPLLGFDLFAAAVPARACLKAFAGLVVSGAVFALAVLFTNHNGREIWEGVLYSEGLEQSILFVLRFCFLGLAAQVSLYRFGQSGALRALAILLSPLKLFGLPGTAAARAVYRSLHLIPSILPRLARMLKKGVLDADEFFAHAKPNTFAPGRLPQGGAANLRHGNASRGAGRGGRRVYFALQAGLCLLWLVFALCRPVTG